MKLILFVVVIAASSLSTFAQSGTLATRLQIDHPDVKVVAAVTDAFSKPLGQLKTIRLVKDGGDVLLTINMMSIDDPKPFRYAVTLQILQRAECTGEIEWIVLSTGINVVPADKLKDWAEDVSARLSQKINQILVISKGN
jgi:hypothetical protein